MLHPPTAWILGASTGIGLALARQLHADGWRLIVSARSEQALQDLADATDALALACDATDAQSLKNAATSAFSSGHINCVVHNVGDYQPTHWDNFSCELVERLSATNFITAARLIEIARPLLQSQGGGELVFNASPSAYRGLPSASAYGASKAALLNMVEALTPEANQHNIKLRVINPGFVRTRLTARNDFEMPFLIDPEQAATRIARGLRGSHFEISFPRRLIWPMKLMRLLPYPWYFGLTSRLLR